MALQPDLYLVFVEISPPFRGPTVALAEQLAPSKV